MDCLEEGLRAHGRPEIFNTDQGSPFTNTAVTGMLLREEIAISMDGRGRALDNIFKDEEIDLKGDARAFSWLLSGILMDEGRLMRTLS